MDQTINEQKQEMDDDQRIRIFGEYMKELGEKLQKVSSRQQKPAEAAAAAPEDVPVARSVSPEAVKEISSPAAVPVTEDTPMETEEGAVDASDNEDGEEVDDEKDEKKRSKKDKKKKEKKSKKRKHKDKHDSDSDSQSEGEDDKSKKSKKKSKRDSRD